MDCEVAHCNFDVELVWLFYCQEFLGVAPTAQSPGILKLLQGVFVSVEFFVKRWVFDVRARIKKSLDADTTIGF